MNLRHYWGRPGALDRKLRARGWKRAGDRRWLSPSGRAEVVYSGGRPRLRQVPPGAPELPPDAEDTVEIEVP